MINRKVKTSRIGLEIMLTEIGLDGELDSVSSAVGQAKSRAEV